ncbi:tyrosine-type recombinase/integrase [Thermococcus sp. JdF3]|uniref:tyrosine-type recombinase/integrase n=1 Tax=Thermococcus sp. JdF3 TaxID=1638258 RepID=UPI00143AB45D|nr:tyrosine-type recombinase/integrase [Thermococcus sp. JdF3]NJE02119.1 hypothetical protein [Thermococcus sp. JdF3]
MAEAMVKSVYEAQLPAGIQIVQRTRGERYGIPASEIERYLNELELKDISEKHKKKQIQFLKEFLSVLPVLGQSSEQIYVVSAVTIEEYLEYLDSLKGKDGQNLGYKVKKDRIATVRRFLTAVGINDPEIINRLKAVETELRRKWKMHVAMNTKTVTKEDIDNLFRALEDLFEDYEIKEEQYCKTLAFLLLLATTGRRKEEIARAHISWFDFEHNIIRLPHSATKVGRQLKEVEGFEILPLHPEARACLKMYTAKFKYAVEANDGYLFAVPTRKSENPTFFDALIKKHKSLRVKLIYSPGTLTAGMFRKFFIQYWYEKGGNELILKKLVGHSPSTVHELHYARGLHHKKLFEEYNRVFGNVRFLTKKQRAMVSRYLPKKGKRKRRRRR